MCGGRNSEVYARLVAFNFVCRLNSKHPLRLKIKNNFSTIVALMIQKSSSGVSNSRRHEETAEIWCDSMFVARTMQQDIFLPRFISFAFCYLIGWKRNCFAWIAFRTKNNAVIFVVRTGSAFLFHVHEGEVIQRKWLIERGIFMF